MVRAVDDLEEALRAASVVLVSLADDRAVLDVCVRQGALQRSLRPGTLVIDTSSTRPDTARAVAMSCRESGLRFIDAPISGGVEAARDGTLSLLCGGETRDVTEALTLLGCLANEITHVGGHGVGQAAKLVNQVIMAGALLGAAEGVALATAAGIDAGALIAALRGGAAGSWVLDHRAPLMVTGSFPSFGALALHLKDLNNALAFANELDLELPGAAMVRDVEQQLEHEGYGGENVAAIARAYVRYG